MKLSQCSKAAWTLMTATAAPAMHKLSIQLERHSYAVKLSLCSKAAWTQAALSSRCCASPCSSSVCPPCRPVAWELGPAMVNAVMTYLQATAALQSHQGGQPRTGEQSQAESLLMAGEHTQAKSSSCARSPLTLPGRLVFALASLARLQRTAGWARTADCPAAAGCRAMFLRSEAPPCQRPRSPQHLELQEHYQPARAA